MQSLGAASAGRIRRRRLISASVARWVEASNRTPPPENPFRTRSVEGVATAEAAFSSGILYSLLPISLATSGTAYSHYESTLHSLHQRK